MCNVDTGVLGQVWYDQESPEAFPDFNTKHTCKNYEDIRIWAEKNQVRDQSIRAPMQTAANTYQEPAPEDLPLGYMKAPEGVLPDIP